MVTRVQRQGLDYISDIWRNSSAEQALLCYQFSSSMLARQVGVDGMQDVCQNAVKHRIHEFSSFHDCVPWMSMALVIDACVSTVMLGLASHAPLAELHKGLTTVTYNLHALVSSQRREQQHSRPGSLHDAANVRRTLRPAFFVTSCCLSLVTLVWQLRAGSRRQRRARRALYLFPPLVAVSILACGVGRAGMSEKMVIRQFMFAQMLVPIRPALESSDGGSLYALLSRTRSYAGQAACQKPGCVGRDPYRRWLEHLAFAPHAMRREPASTIGFWWLAGVTSKQMLNLAESSLIASASTTENRTFNRSPPVQKFCRGRRRSHRRLRLRQVVFYQSSHMAPLAEKSCTAIAMVHLSRPWPPRPVARNRFDRMLEAMILPFGAYILYFYV
mmetsp:Transcript_60268/g.108514  ORF Transcript_60268/g.108514 Transcript_60268/m.108514 type:complete len:387 (-) Transcript_60268:129-1289(-)